MPLMLSELYDALLEAGASEEKARKAAEAAAVVDTRFTALEGRMTTLDARMTALEGRMTTLTWGIGIGFSLVMALLLLALNWLWQILGRLP
jgi:hypothetical protein